jgi:lipopolysaccharide/colanic/teichoic acid biosynthesis glycosyltransferase
MRVEKRLFDLLSGALGLGLLWPLLVAIAVLIKLDDGGPVFFRQVRVGYRGRPFRIWKFRTMVPDTTSQGILLTVGDDHRVTRAGRWLRRWKLDELPQLFNVLTGEMSFVGPRPELPYYVARYSAAERRVLDFVPGLTGEASLRYRDESELLGHARDPERAFVEGILPEKVRLNLAYGDRATLWTDCGVILRTMREILAPSGCGGPEARAGLRDATLVGSGRPTDGSAGEAE